MEMTYDGALVMPSGCALMDEEEMTYLVGGGAGQAVAYQVVKVGVNAVFNSLLGGGSLGAIRSVISAFGTATIKSTIKTALLKWVSARVANAIVGGIVGKLLDFATFSVGGAVAEILDRADGSNDNQIYFSKVRF